MIKIWLWRKLASGAVETGPSIQGIIKNILWSLFTCYVVPDSLWPHWLQHIRFLCIPLPPGVCTNICPLSQWWYLPHLLLPPSPFDFSHSQDYIFSNGFTYQMAIISEYQHQSFQWIFRVTFLSVWMLGSPCSPRDSQESSPAPQSKASVLWHSDFFTVQLSHP